MNSCDVSQTHYYREDNSQVSVQSENFDKASNKELKANASVVFTICPYTFVVLYHHFAWLRRLEYHISIFIYLFYTLLLLQENGSLQIHNTVQVAIIVYFCSTETFMAKMRVHQEKIVCKLATILLTYLQINYTMCSFFLSQCSLEV